MRIVCGLLILFGIAACSNPEAYNKRLEALRGLSEAELVGKWGNPDKFYETPAGVRFLTYEYGGTSINPGNLHQGGNIAPYTVEYFCNTTFELNEDKVTDWTFNGTTCN